MKGQVGVRGYTKMILPTELYLLVRQTPEMV
jgi:hypothetical protein